MQIEDNSIWLTMAYGLLLTHRNDTALIARSTHGGIARKAVVAGLGLGASEGFGAKVANGY